MADIKPLNLSFAPEEELAAEKLNKIPQKVDEIIREHNQTGTPYLLELSSNMITVQASSEGYTLQAVTVIVDVAVLLGGIDIIDECNISFVDVPAGVSAELRDNRIIINIPDSIELDAVNRIVVQSSHPEYGDRNKIFSIVTVKEGKKGNPGDPGEPGAPGDKTVHLFARSADESTASSSVSPTIDGTWSVTAPLPTSAYPYLWQKTSVFTYDTVSKQYSEDPSTISYARVTGLKGVNGKSVKTKWIDTKLAVWIEGDPEPVTGKELKGSPGSPGAPGAPGANGDKTVHLFARSADESTASSSTAPDITGNWSVTAPLPVSGYPYLWQRTSVYVWDSVSNSYKEDATTISYSRVTGLKGVNGKSVKTKWVNNTQLAVWIEGEAEPLAGVELKGKSAVIDINNHELRDDDGHKVIIPWLNNGSITLEGGSIKPLTKHQSLSDLINASNKLPYSLISNTPTIPSVAGFIKAGDVTWAQILKNNSNANPVTWATLGGTKPSLSDFNNDSGYITGINKSMVIGALDYTPFNSEDFTKNKIQTTLGIKDWALGDKPTAADIGALASNVNIKNITGFSDLKIPTVGTKGEIKVGDTQLATLADLNNIVVKGYYLPLSGGTLTGLLTANSALKVKGRVYGSGDDEGIIIEKASNNYAGLILGGNTGVRSCFYLYPDGSAKWSHNTGITSYSIKHPDKDGTIALTSDIPTSLPANGGTANDAKSLSNASSSVLTNQLMYFSGSGYAYGELPWNEGFCLPANAGIADGNGYGIRFGWLYAPYYHDIVTSPNICDLWHRDTHGGGWRKIIDSGNISSYAVVNGKTGMTSVGTGGIAVWSDAGTAVNFITKSNFISDLGLLTTSFNEDNKQTTTAGAVTLGTFMSNLSASGNKLTRSFKPVVLTKENVTHALGNTYLPLSGGTMTGDLGLSIEDNNWNNAGGLNVNCIKLLRAINNYEGNAYDGFSSGISIMGGYVGFQLATDGGETEDLAFRKINGYAAWTRWHQLLHTGNIGSQSVAYATTAGLSRRVEFSGIGTCEIKAGTSDHGGNFNTFANMIIKSWWGISFIGYNDAIGAYLDCRDGNMGLKGNLSATSVSINGNTAIHAGNIGSYAIVNGQQPQINIGGGIAVWNDNMTAVNRIDAEHALSAIGALSTSGGSLTGTLNVNGVNLSGSGAVTDAALRIRSVSGYTKVHLHSAPPSSYSGNYLYINGTSYATAHTNVSDMTQKVVIKPTEIKLDDIANAPIFLYKLKDMMEMQPMMGSSAQYWVDKSEGIVMGEYGSYTMNYSNLALAACVSVANKVKSIEDKIKELEAELKKLKSE